MLLCNYAVSSGYTSEDIQGWIILKLISWNIDSLNAALTGTSARSELSRKVLDTIREHDPDVIALQETKLPGDGPSKKHMEVLGEKFPGYAIVWNSSVEPARRVMQARCFYSRIILTLPLHFRK